MLPLSQSPRLLNGVIIFPPESPLCFKPGQLSSLLASSNRLSYLTLPFNLIINFNPKLIIKISTYFSLGFERRQSKVQMPVLSFTSSVTLGEWFLLGSVHSLCRVVE